MKLFRPVALAGASAALCLMPGTLCAQQTASTEHHSHYDSWSAGDSTDTGRRAFVFHQGDETPVQGFESHGGNGYGSRAGEHAERRYAETHAGTYVLFLEGGQMHRLDDAKDMAEVASFHERMRPLEAQQRELGIQQRPLSARMDALGRQMHATTDTARMTELGSQMNALGKQMSALGEQQSAIGKQQGELGHAMGKRVSELIEACLKNNTCPVVATPSA